ncbi:MAG: glycosyltransferase family 2 protein [Pedobacter sp.]
MTKISISIVTYNISVDDFEKVYRSLYKTSTRWTLYVIDNSPKNDLYESIKDDKRVVYVHNPSNPGFGAAHNIALELATASGAEYHFIVNPDIYFYEDVITPMIEYMESHSDVGMLMPQILNTDGSVQYLPKLLPSPFWIFRRKLRTKINLYGGFLSKYELRSVSNSKIYNTPILSGCFTLLNLEAVKKVGTYDDRFFMYFEDFDLSRRIHKEYKTLYFPKVSVYHNYEGGANKSLKLFTIFIASAVKYFNKWGWLFDKQRKSMNKKTLAQF